MRKETFENCELYLGDCLEIMPTLPDASVDLVLTDPPYGITACKWDKSIPFTQMWAGINRIKKIETAVVLFGAEPFSSKLRMSNIEKYKYDWIWEKNQAVGFLNAKKAPLKIYENISVFYEKTKYYPQKYLGKPYFKKNRKRTRKFMGQNSQSPHHQTERAIHKIFCVLEWRIVRLATL